MTRKYKITATILIICMCVLSAFPEQVIAQDTQETQTTQETQEADTQTATAQEESVQEGQTTAKEDAAATLGGGETAQEESEEADEMSEEMSEESKTVEDDDPGQGRLSGDVPEDFYGESLKTRAASKGVTHDSRFASYKKYQGIDVSRYNNENSDNKINWTKVKAAGISFAFVRVAYRGYGSAGTLRADQYAEQNIKNASAAGIKVGAYIFSQAITTSEAVEEADYIVKLIEKYNVKSKITMPIVFDFEYASEDGKETGRLKNAKLSKSTQTAICLAFCNRIKAKGYTPCVYANQNMLTTRVDESKISSQYQIWLARYASKADYAGTYTYWQYSSTGKVNGITGNVDMNYAYIAPGSSLGNATNTGSSSGNSGSSSSSSAVTVGKTTLSGKAGSFDSVKLSWKKVSGANGYVIYRYDSSSKSYKKIKTISSGSTVSYTDGSKNASTTYKYQVKAYKKSGSKTYYSSVSNTVSVKTSGSATGKTTGTSVYVRSGPSTSKSKLTKLGINTGVTLTGSSGNWYRISIKIKGKKKTAYISKDYVTIIKKPTLKASASSSSKIKLSWNKISGANGYQIQRYDSKKKKWVTVKTITKGSTVSYTNSGLKKNTTYKYKIRSYKKVRGHKIYSYYCDAKSAKTKK